MFTKFSDSVRSYLRSRETQFALRGLSDAALDDIGLTRAGLASLGPHPAPARRETAAAAVAPSFMLPLPFQGFAQQAA